VRIALSSVKCILQTLQGNIRWVIGLSWVQNWHSKDSLQFLLFISFPQWTPLLKQQPCRTIICLQKFMRSWIREQYKELAC
jgi:hypothetical protein